MRRLAPFGRAIQVIVWSVSICWVIVAIFVGFIINIVAISVTLAGRRRATIGSFTMKAIFIRPVTVGTLSVRAITIRMTSVWITIAVTTPSILVGAVWSVIIRIVIGLRRMMVVLGSFRSFLQDGPDWFVLSQWDGDPAMVVVDAGPLSRVSVHQ